MSNPTLVALLDDDGIVEQLALFADFGSFYRDEGDWMPVATDDEDDPITGLEPVDTNESFVPLFDMAQDTDATLTRSDVPLAKD